MLTRCLGCNVPSQGPRCPRCTKAQRSIYAGDWTKVARDTVARHVARHGWRCFGDAHHQPHDTHDLTVDHVTPGSRAVLRVVCRASNTAKAKRG